MGARKKKYNPMKTLLTNVNYGLKHLAVFKSPNDTFCKVINTVSGNDVTVTPSMAAAIGDIRHNWLIVMVVIGFDGQRYYYKSEEVFARDYLQSDLADYLEQHHKAFAKRVMNPNHYRGLSWFAIPRDRELTPEQIDKILDKHNCYC